VGGVEQVQALGGLVEATLGWLVADSAVPVAAEGVGNAGPVEPGL